jgi:hypothetical protein
VTSIDMTELPEEAAPNLLHILSLALHCSLHHGQFDLITRDDGDFLVSICADNCAAHFEVLCREAPFETDNTDWFVELFIALHDATAKAELYGNGMSIITADRTYRVFRGIE